MPVYQLGSINTTALIVPDLYVQIVPPQISLLNGVPTNILGIVGSASWGPVNNPTDVGSMAEFASIFGSVKARKYDMGTACALAVLQGAQAMKCVRVTDGNDTAASGLITATDAIKAVTVAGTARGTDVLTLTITPSGGSAVALVYTMSGTDTVNSGAVALQALVNANATLLAAGIIADTPSTGVFNIHYPTAAVATVSGAVTGSAATTTLVAAVASTLSTTQITITSKWTGSLGNSISVVLSAGAAASSTRAVVSIPGAAPEAFDNITGAGNAFWTALANAFNLGQSGMRGPSNIVVATLGFGASAVTLPTTVSLAGGKSGADGVTSTTLVGTDTI